MRVDEDEKGGDNKQKSGGFWELLISPNSSPTRDAVLKRCAPSSSPSSVSLSHGTMNDDDDKGEKDERFRGKGDENKLPPPTFQSSPSTYPPAL